ncbi:MAG: DNA mismatch repair endonuclease MutL [Holosporales bacterium]|jgi:DNA mismatch repair protein MutL|nr:DNA mismatch repair endonuclease MutL [Holosporales bacterium]
MAKIKLLSDEIINQIAAGEIVERPASALKEIVENAIDADAKNIDVFLMNGGKSKIVVEDDGFGLSKEDILMSVKRHATSKLNDSNLFSIASYGFRGEALPSIAAVSNFSIESNGFGVSVNFSDESDVYPSPVKNGTKVTVESLFDKIPARLKFLKSDSVELTNCASVVENFSLTRKDINFVLRTENKTILSFRNDSLEERASKILGSDLFERAVSFKESDETATASGYLFHPMDNRYSQSFQRTFVNGRIVKDKIISLSLRNAYRDLIPAGRFAAAIIFIEIDPFHIDVNVSPTKSEVRFRDSSYAQKFLTNAISKNLSRFDRHALDFDASKIASILDIKRQTQPSVKHEEPKEYIVREGTSGLVVNNASSSSRLSQAKTTIPQIVEEANKPGFFGEPIGQAFDSYIITEVEDGILIIDQHAVHEKITQYKIMKSLNPNNKQFMMKPEVIELTRSQLSVAKAIVGYINDCGFKAEILRDSAIIHAIPAVLNIDEAIAFIRDVLETYDETTAEDIKVIDVLKRKIADVACHNSIRFGRKLSREEMIEIIKQMENTPTIHQCNHHRPSFFKISKEQLEKTFERK